MLAKFWRLHFYWVGDQTLTYASGARVKVVMNAWKLVAGILTYQDITDNMGFTSGTIVTAGMTEGDVQDNTSALNYGVTGGSFEIIADVSGTDGYGYLYLETSPDNTNWPSDKDNFNVTKLRPIATLGVSTNAVDESQSADFEF